MWSCSFWTQPQKVVGYHRETHHFREEKSTKNLPPRNTPDLFCRLLHPTKSIAALRGRYFSFTGNAPWKFHEPTERDTDFSSTPLHKQGQELRSEQTAIPITWAEPLYLFCALTIRKHLLKMRFERSGRGQEPSRGHKFSILENVVLHRDFTSAMRPHFRSDLVGACLPQTLPSNNKVHNYSMDWV